MKYFLIKLNKLSFDLKVYSLGVSKSLNLESILRGLVFKFKFNQKIIKMLNALIRLFFLVIFNLGTYFFTKFSCAKIVKMHKIFKQFVIF